MEKIKTLPKQVVFLKSIELINFSALFIALAVSLPWVAHQFNLAGPIFLPMHLIVLVAGLLFGWRAGLIVGLLTPLISFTTSGMPMLPVLPQITIEVMIYGLIAGLCREWFKMNLYVSLLLAMVVGRLFLLLSIVVLQTSQISPVVNVWDSIKVGWPGILIQLAIVPIAVIYLKKYLGRVSKLEN